MLIALHSILMFQNNYMYVYKKNFSRYKFFIFNCILFLLALCVVCANRQEEAPDI